MRTFACDSCGKTAKGLYTPSRWTYCDIANYHRLACSRVCLRDLVYQWLGFDSDGRFDGMWQDVPVDNTIL